MALLKYVLPWPSIGHPDRPWLGSEPDPTGVGAATDVALRSARCVSDLYRQAVAELGIQHRTSELRLWIRSEAGRDGQVVAGHDVDPTHEGFETGSIRVPPSFARLPARTRAEVLLEAIHGIVLGHAETRGWQGDFESCRQSVIDQDFRLSHVGAWKSAPGRRHKARVRCWMTPDMAGYGRAVLEIANTDGEIVAQTDEATAFSTLEGFQRSAKSVKWKSKDSVSAIPFGGYGDPIQLGLLSLNLRDGAWHPTVFDPTQVLDLSRPDPATPVPEVIVVPTGLTADNDERRIAMGSGGPVEAGEIEVFHEHAQTLLEPFHSEPGRAWWAASPIRHLSGYLWYGAAKTRVRARLVGNELNVYADVSSTDLAEHGPEAWAEVVVGMIVEKVRQRTGLGPHPGYPAQE